MAEVRSQLPFIDMYLHHLENGCLGSMVAQNYILFEWSKSSNFSAEIGGLNKKPWAKWQF